MFSKKVILCVDRGTTELKVVLFDLMGKNCGMVSRRCSIISCKTDWLETDLNETLSLLTDCVKVLSEIIDAEHYELICISVTSYMSGTIFLDKDMHPIGNAVLWNDSRTKKLTEEWERSGILDKCFELSGSQILTGWPIPLLSWWKKNDPAVLERAKYLISMKDWIRFKLTGVVNTDVTEAVLAPGDISSRGYSDDILKLFDVYDCKHILAPVREPEYVVGGLLPEFASRSGLKAGIPVVTGIGDMPSGVLGTGALHSGHGSTVLGTTFLNGLIIDRPQPEPRSAGMTCSYVENHMLRMVNNTGGAAINYQWFIDNFYQSELEKYGADGIFDYIDRSVSAVPPGANGVMYHPYINSCGVTAPFLSIGARAQFSGIGLHNTRSDMLRAIYEGIGLAMRDCYYSVPVDLVDITLTGGGSKSSALCQIAADVCGVPIHIPEEKEATALGAAIVGSVGIGEYSSYEESINHMVRREKTFYPNNTDAQRYRALYDVYFEVRNGMRKAWDLRRTLNV